MDVKLTLEIITALPNPNLQSSSNIVQFDPLDVNVMSQTVRHQVTPKKVVRGVALVIKEPFIHLVHARTEREKKK